MKLLIVDKLPRPYVEKLREIVKEIEYAPDITAETLPDHMPGVNILVVRGTKVTSAAINAADALELIVRSGAGTENIDLNAASERAIYITNCPDKNAAAVAELTIGLMLALDRHIPDATVALREGRWNKERFAKARGLKDRVFGVIGAGAVGREVIKRAKAFDMPVIAWSRSLTDEKAKELEVSRAATIDELLSRSDVISIHIAYVPETRHLLSAERIAMLRPGAIVLNTSRGAIVDNVALAEALKAGHIYAGLDVYENEPEEGNAEFKDVLLGVSNWIGTPHIGASTDQAQRATADETVRIIETFVRTGEVENCVNYAKHTPAAYELIVRHYDKIGVLTGILNDLRASKINVQEVHNIIFEGAKAAVAHIQLDVRPSQNTLDKVLARKNEIIDVELIELKPNDSSLTKINA